MTSSAEESLYQRGIKFSDFNIFKPFSTNGGSPMNRFEPSQNVWDVPNCTFLKPFLANGIASPQ